MRVSIASQLMQPSPNGRRVGIRINTFEACSGFTHVTARRIAQPPKATFVARLRPDQLPSQAARQLPDLSTIIRVESSSTDGSRLRGARPQDAVSSRDNSHRKAVAAPPFAHANMLKPKPLPCRVHRFGRLQLNANNQCVGVNWFNS